MHRNLCVCVCVYVYIYIYAYACKCLCVDRVTAVNRAFEAYATSGSIVSASQYFCLVGPSHRLQGCPASSGFGSFQKSRALIQTPNSRAPKNKDSHKKDPKFLETAISGGIPWLCSYKPIEPREGSQGNPIRPLRDHEGLLRAIRLLGPIRPCWEDLAPPV